MFVIKLMVHFIEHVVAVCLVCGMLFVILLGGELSVCVLVRWSVAVGASGLLLCLFYMAHFIKHVVCLILFGFWLGRIPSIVRLGACLCVCISSSFSWTCLIAVLIEHFMDIVSSFLRACGGRSFIEHVVGTSGLGSLGLG